MKAKGVSVLLQANTILASSEVSRVEGALSTTDIEMLIKHGNRDTRRKALRMLAKRMVKKS